MLDKQSEYKRKLKLKLAGEETEQQSEQQSTQVSDLNLSKNTHKQQTQETEGKTTPEQKAEPEVTPRRSDKVKIKHNFDGKYRKINPDILEHIFKSKFSASEHSILLYLIWNITASKTRNYVNVKNSTLQNKVNLSRSQVLYTLERLKDRRIITFKEEDNRTRIYLTTNYQEWLTFKEWKANNSKV